MNPPTDTAISKRLKQVTDAIEEKLRKYAGSDYFPDVTFRSPVKKDYLQAQDISSKDDLLWLSSLLPVLQKGNNIRDQIQIRVITNLFSQYPLAKMDLTDDELYSFIRNWRDCNDDTTYRWNMSRLFKIVTKRVNDNGLNEALKNTLLLFKMPETTYMFSEHRKINEQIAYLLQDTSAVAVNRYDEWGPKVLHFIDSLADERKKKSWVELIRHALSVCEKSYPPKGWKERAEALLKEVGEDAFASQLTEWLSFVGALIQDIHKRTKMDFLRDKNHDLLKSLIWYAGLVNRAELTTTLDRYAAMAYKKMPGVGAISAKTGNACMYAFSLLPFKEAVTRLMKFRNRIVNNTILKSIDKIISEVAQRNGQEKDLLEEIGVMDFGLNENSGKQWMLDPIICQIEVKATEVLVNWSKDGQRLKSVPATIKSVHKTAYKELTNEVKELTTQLQVQKDRIEGYYLCNKSWKYSDWFQNYFQHPLVKAVASALIWTFQKNDRNEVGIWENGKFNNVLGQPLTWLDEDTTVVLWHPIMASVQEVVNWRIFIQEREITQPFKQAYREVYLLTEAELRTQTYSNRFAAHVLRQHQFAALCRQRRWKYHLMGSWDSHNTPSLMLPHYHLTVQYFVDADGNGTTNEAGIFLYITTDQVRFYKDSELQALIDIPKVVFSEVMRDVDLFVGVCSIGNDPAWTDNGGGAYTTYWRAYSFGDLSESAKVRSEVLQRLVPRLKIRDKCSFEGKFLVVKGQLRTYKIHMGSGNILMEPNDQYLCIVPDGSKIKPGEKIYLPFEGDQLLSIIISKALLLAEDDKIKDETIVRQIT